MTHNLPFRIYADTRLFDGTANPEMPWALPWFVEEIRQGLWRLVVAMPVLHMPAFRDLQLPSHAVEAIDPALGVSVQHAYLQAGIVPTSHAEAALQVALATVAYCAILISWDSRYITHHQQKIRYQAVNQSLGYPAVALHLPPAVLHYDEDHDVPSAAVQWKRRHAIQREQQER